MLPRHLRSKGDLQRYPWLTSGHPWLTTGYSWVMIAHSWLTTGHYWALMCHYSAFMGDHQNFMDDYHACIFRRILVCIEREARCIDAPAEGPCANLGREVTRGNEGRTHSGLHRARSEMHRRASGGPARKPWTGNHERMRGAHFRGHLNPKTEESGWTGVGRL